jgi:hypothetical protein
MQPTRNSSTRWKPHLPRAGTVLWPRARAPSARQSDDHRSVTGGSRRWLGLVALTIGVAMTIVDATIVKVAIPSIIRDLGIGITQAEWANSISPVRLHADP